MRTIWIFSHIMFGHFHMVIRQHPKSHVWFRLWCKMSRQLISIHFCIVLFQDMPGFRGMRYSKFRHVYGSPYRREKCYNNIPITKNSHDANFCAVNPKFLAIILESQGGGAFICVPIERVSESFNFLIFFYIKTYLFLCYIILAK